jgi:hypothetical protein
MQNCSYRAVIVLFSMILLWKICVFNNLDPGTFAQAAENGEFAHLWEGGGVGVGLAILATLRATARHPAMAGVS